MNGIAKGNVIRRPKLSFSHFGGLREYDVRHHSREASLNN